MRTLDAAAFNDEKSVTASTLNDIWDKHISTINFGDHVSKSNSNRLNQANLTSLSNADILSNQSRKSRRSRVKTAISRGQDFIRSSIADGSMLKLALSKFKEYKINS